MKKPNLGVSLLTNTIFIFDESISHRDGDNVNVDGEQIDVTSKVVQCLAEFVKGAKENKVTFTSQEDGSKFEFRKVL